MYTILVSNTDDHLKNHGFIYAGDGRWSLSQLFDVNPQPERHRLLKTAIIEGERFAASLELALDAAMFFNLAADEAKRIAHIMARQINGTWKSIMRNHGLSGADLRSLEPAFEHQEMERALSL